MISGNIIIAFVLMQYTVFFLSLLNKNKLNEVTSKNLRIEELRQTRTKTLEEQKEFLTLRYGTGLERKIPFKKKAQNFLKSTLIFLLFYAPFYYSGIRTNFWLVLLISIIVVMIINKILIKFNLQRQDGLDTLFR